MTKKKSNLCLAVDYTTAKEVLEITEKAGPYLICVKIHSDAIVDFSQDFVKKLVALAEEHDFLIFEDRSVESLSVSLSLSHPFLPESSETPETQTCFN